MKTMTDNAVRRFLCIVAVSVTATFFPVSAMARDALKLTDADYMRVDAQLKSAEGHPNEVWRYRGLKSYLSGQYGEAVEHFERAAGYADKFSQHYLSLIHWHGQGVPVDRAQAYVWSDLAAERGGKRLLIIREKMWAQLDADQRAEVASRGDAFYACYGDSVAKPKAEKALRRFAAQKTGSRVGYNNQNIDIIMGGPIHGSFTGSPGLMAASAMVTGGSDEQQLYAKERTQAAAYWREQDRALDPHTITVEVGPVSEVPKNE
jgi:TPR repeat protein